MIDLSQAQLECVRRILQQHAPGIEVRVFGSRVKGTARRFSDLDLALVASSKLSWKQLEALKNAFSESDLPILVDVVDWWAISDSFRECISDHYEILAVS